jgi:glycosyltransferase involved in cell wall biosynthesis
MRVVLVSKALVVGAYQRKAEEIAALGIDLTVLIPPSWRDSRGDQPAERVHTRGYTLHTIPLHLNGQYHLHHYPTLARELARLRPDLLHMDEEPYNVATWLALRTAQRLGIPATFFTWQNLLRRYPMPFQLMEQQVYRQVRLAIAGNRAAGDVLRTKGFAGEIALIPQFGVDPLLFSPRPEINDDVSARPLVIGYAGGLLPEKGLDLLLDACRQLNGDWRLELAGEGGQQPALAAQAQRLDMTGRVRFLGKCSSSAMPAFYHTLDVLVLPSRSQPNWKEQFGRVLIEAMACGVPVIGSTCGEIPVVIGDAGRIFPENDGAALTAALQSLLDDPAQRTALAAAGRRRVLAHFTMQQVAVATVAAYRQLLALGGQG